jgi:DNA-binding LacI/PurR family transcriptional regulator
MGAQARGVPLVLVGRCIPGCEAGYVGTQNEDMAWLLGNDSRARALSHTIACGGQDRTRKEGLAADRRRGRSYLLQAQTTRPSGWGMSKYADFAQVGPAIDDR